MAGATPYNCGILMFNPTSNAGDRTPTATTRLAFCSYVKFSGRAGALPGVEIRIYSYGACGGLNIKICSSGACITYHGKEEATRLIGLGRSGPGTRRHECIQYKGVA
jgi:hypothetical protein